MKRFQSRLLMLLLVENEKDKMRKGYCLPHLLLPRWWLHSTKGDFACKSIKKPPIWPLAAGGWEINDFSRSLRRGEIYIFNAAAMLGGRMVKCISLVPLTHAARSKGSQINQRLHACHPLV
jgi:hypothetical protein